MDLLWKAADHLTPKFLTGGIFVGTWKSWRRIVRGISRCSSLGSVLFVGLLLSMLMDAGWGLVLMV